MRGATFRRKSPALGVLALAVLALAGFSGCEPDQAPGRDLTILLVEYKGPQAVASARRLADDLRRQGLAEVFVVEGADEASVCVGRFRSWKDPAADRMLARVRRIRDAQGQFPFAGVLLVPVPEPTPPNPWPLEKAPGQFTLHVASWEAPGRKQKATAFARALRRQGYEAYIYHGPRFSMVTIGAFGLDIFDDPSKVGRPGAKPKVVDPKVLRLIQAFPRMRLEGEVTPPEAHVPTQLVKVPGKEPAAVPGFAQPKALYRVTLLMVETETGLAEGRLRASGVAQGKEEIPTLVGVLVRQLLEGLAGRRLPVVGAAGVAADAGSEADGLGPMVLEALEAALKAGGVGKIRLYSHEATARLLAAQRLTVGQVARDTLRLKGLPGLDYVVVATVEKVAPPR